MVRVRTDSKGVTDARSGRECSVCVSLGFARGKRADSKRLREVCLAELQECLEERRVWWLTFKSEISIGIIVLSKYTCLLFGTSCGKEFERETIWKLLRTRSPRRLRVM
jgi:hypothetical protein